MSDGGDKRDDYYAVLGVSPEANVAAIRAAYRDRVKETHPDQNDAPDASEEFQRVKRAEEVLTDPEERARYDRLGHEEYIGDGTAGGGQGRQQGSRERERARWTADGWTGSAGSTTASGTAAGAGADPSGATTGSAGGEAAESADLGSRLTAFARLLERYRFDIDPKTAVFGMATFFLYPVFLASSVTPRFPIVVNLILVCCLLCTVGYLLATPEVGVPVFGAWSLFGPIMFIFVDRPLFSWAGFFLVSATLVPFGLSLMILEMLRLE
jgi:molecular chaperone DnaJ